MKIIETIEDIERVVIDFHKSRRRRLNLNAIDNIVSPTVLSLLSNNFITRPLLLGNEPTNIHFRKIDEMVVESGKKLFDTKYCEWRSLGGQPAGIQAICGLMQRGDTMLELESYSQQHATGWYFSRGGPVDLKVDTLPFDEKEWVVDIDAAAKKIKETKPKLVFIGISGPLFPNPSKEMKEICEEAGSYYMEDLSHTMGLLAGKHWPNPIKGGADIVVGNCHKTLAGPFGALILSDNFEVFDKVRMQRRTLQTGAQFFRLPAYLALFLEWQKWGDKWASQIVKNAKRLAETLYNFGFKVLCPDKGFTESHVVLIDMTEFGTARGVSHAIARGNITCYPFGFAGRKVQRFYFADEQYKGYMFPEDEVIKKAGWTETRIRLGVQEVTRIGMKEDDMETIAEFIKQLFIDKEEPAVVAEEVTMFVSNFNDIEYSFDKGSGIGPYDFVRLDKHIAV